jgi:hypothetical protein
MRGEGDVAGGYTLSRTLLLYDIRQMNRPQIETVFLSYPSQLSSVPHPRAFIDAARDAVRQARFYARDMAVFGARSNPPPATCISEVERCDAYVGIFGPFYGTEVPDGTGRSYTMLEFESAERARKPIFVFLLSPEYFWPVTWRETDIKYEAQLRFLAKVRQSTRFSYEEFASPDALERQVFGALVQHSLSTSAPAIAMEPSASTVTQEPSRLAAAIVQSGTIVSDELVNLASLICEIKDSATQRLLAGWLQTTRGTTDALHVFNHIIVDRAKPLRLRIAAVPLVEHLLGNGGESFSLEQLPAEITRIGDADLLQVASATGRVVQYANDRHYGRIRQPHDGFTASLVLNLLRVLSKVAASSSLVFVARALYVLAGLRAGDTVNWQPYYSGEGARATLNAVLEDVDCDPLVARYLLYVFSRCRDTAPEVDIVYELAYACDLGVNPVGQLTCRQDRSSATEREMLSRYLAGKEEELRWAAAVCTARLGHAFANLFISIQALLREVGSADEVLREELWAHLVWLDDPASLEAMKAADIVYDAPARLAVSWLLRHRAIDAVAVVGDHPVATLIIHELETRRDTFQKLAADATTAVHTRWLDTPSGRTYLEAGLATKEILRARKDLLKLWQGLDAEGRQCWFFLRVSRPTLDRFYEAVSSKIPYNLTKFGTILSSGFGAAPDQKDIDHIRVTYGVDYGAEG